jgi:hypothetical protein
LTESGSPCTQNLAHTSSGSPRTPRGPVRGRGRAGRSLGTHSVGGHGGTCCDCAAHGETRAVALEIAQKCRFFAEACQPSARRSAAAHALRASMNASGSRAKTGHYGGRGGFGRFPITSQYVASSSTVFLCLQWRVVSGPSETQSLGVRIVDASCFRGEQSLISTAPGCCPRKGICNMDCSFFAGLGANYACARFAPRSFSRSARKRASTGRVS